MPVCYIGLAMSESAPPPGAPGAPGSIEPASPGEDEEGGDAPTIELPRAPPHANGRLAVVVNGNAKSVTTEVIETLDQILDSGDLFVSRRVEESEGIARTLVERGYSTILTGGGDGTFTVVVTAVVKEAKRRGAPMPRFGPLHLGTGNSLAWVLGATKLGERSASARRALGVDLQRLRADAGSRWLPLVEAEGMLSPFCGAFAVV